MKKRKYESPQMEVASIENMQVICQSGGINDMNRDDDQSLDWDW